MFAHRHECHSPKLQPYKENKNKDPVPKQTFLRKNSRQHSTKPSIISNANTIAIGARLQLNGKPDNSLSKMVTSRSTSKMGSKDISVRQSIEKMKTQTIQSQLTTNLEQFYPQLLKKCVPQQSPCPSTKVCQSFLKKQQIQICPQLFFLYNTEHLISQHATGTLEIRKYSRGRKQLKYSDGSIEALYQGVNEIRLTVWDDGDWKLVDGDKVSYWSQQNSDLDQYFID